MTSSISEFPNFQELKDFHRQAKEKPEDVNINDLRKKNDELKQKITELFADGNSLLSYFIDVGNILITEIETLPSGSGDLSNKIIAFIEHFENTIKKFEEKIAAENKDGTGKRSIDELEIGKKFIFVTKNGKKIAMKVDTISPSNGFVALRRLSGGHPIELKNREWENKEILKDLQSDALVAVTTPEAAPALSNSNKEAEPTKKELNFENLFEFLFSKENESDKDRIVTRINNKNKKQVLILNPIGNYESLTSDIVKQILASNAKYAADLERVFGVGINNINKQDFFKFILSRANSLPGIILTAAPESVVTTISEASTTVEAVPVDTAHHADVIPESDESTSSTQPKQTSVSESIESELIELPDPISLIDRDNNEIILTYSAIIDLLLNQEGNPEAESSSEKSLVIDMSSRDILGAIGPELAEHFSRILEISEMPRRSTEESAAYDNKLTQAKEDFKKIFDNLVAKGKNTNHVEHKFITELREQGYSLESFQLNWENTLADQMFDQISKLAVLEYQDAQKFSFRDEINVSANRRIAQGLIMAGVVGTGVVVGRLSSATKTVGAVTGGVVGALARRFFSSEKPGASKEATTQIIEQPKPKNWLGRVMDSVESVGTKTKNFLKSVGVKGEEKNRQEKVKLKKETFKSDLSTDNNPAVRKMAAWISELLRQHTSADSATQPNSGLSADQDPNLFSFKKEAVAKLAVDYSNNHDRDNERRARLDQLTAGLQENNLFAHDSTIQNLQAKYNENNTTQHMLGRLRDLQSGMLWANSNDKTKRMLGLALSATIGGTIGFALGETPGDTRSLLLAGSLGTAGALIGDKMDMQARDVGFKKNLEALYKKTNAQINDIEKSIIPISVTANRVAVPGESLFNNKEDYKKLIKIIADTRQLAAGLTNNLFEPNLALEVRDTLHRARRLYMLTSLEIEQEEIEDVAKQQVEQLTKKKYGWRKLVGGVVGAVGGFVFGQGIEAYRQFMNIGQPTGTTPRAEVQTTSVTNPEILLSSEKTVQTQVPTSESPTNIPASDTAKAPDATPEAVENTPTKSEISEVGVIEIHKGGSAWGALDDARKLDSEKFSEEQKTQWQKLTKSDTKFRAWEVQQLKDMGYVYKNGKWGYPFGLKPGAKLHVFFDPNAKDGAGDFRAAFANDEHIKQYKSVHFRETPKIEKLSANQLNTENVRNFVDDVKTSRSMSVKDTAGAPAKQKIGFIVSPDLAKQEKISNPMGVSNATSYAIYTKDGKLMPEVAEVVMNDNSVIYGSPVLEDFENPSRPGEKLQHWVLHQIQKSKLFQKALFENSSTSSGRGSDSKSFSHIVPQIASERSKFFEDYKKSTETVNSNKSSGGSASVLESKVEVAPSSENVVTKDVEAGVSSDVADRKRVLDSAILSDDEMVVDFDTKITVPNSVPHNLKSSYENFKLLKDSLEKDTIKWAGNSQNSSLIEKINSSLLAMESNSFVADSDDSKFIANFISLFGDKDVAAQEHFFAMKVEDEIVVKYDPNKIYKVIQNSKLEISNVDHNGSKISTKSFSFDKISYNKKKKDFLFNSN